MEGTAYSRPLIASVHMAVATSSGQTSFVFFFWKGIGRIGIGPGGCGARQGERFTRKPCMLISVDSSRPRRFKTAGSGTTDIFCGHRGLNPFSGFSSADPFPEVAPNVNKGRPLPLHARLQVRKMVSLKPRGEPPVRVRPAAPVPK